jgi:type VI protein secretion system component Hcp
MEQPPDTQCLQGRPGDMSITFEDNQPSQQAVQGWQFLRFIASLCPSHRRNCSPFLCLEVQPQISGIDNGESKMNTATKILGASLFSCAAFCTASLAEAAIYVKIPHIPGDVQGPDGEHDWFIADSFAFGVEREMNVSGEKGGTQDLNIGVGELQECTISKSMDRTSALLAQFAINGNSPGDCEVCFSNETDARTDQPICYLKYKLDRAFIKSWSTSGDADDRPTEEVAFYFTKIAYGQQTDAPDGSLHMDDMSWDRWMNQPWEEGLSDIYDDIGGTPPPVDPPSCEVP